MNTPTLATDGTVASGPRPLTHRDHDFGRPAPSPIPQLRVWVGCLQCYNSGHLVGTWCDAIDAADLSLEEVHQDGPEPTAYCEELWCFDTDEMPRNVEMDPLTAADWGEHLSTYPDEHLAPLLAWIREAGAYVLGPGHLPTADEFSEMFHGHHESFRDYGLGLIDETGLLDGMPEHLRGYFDTDSWIRDLGYDHYCIDVPTWSGTCGVWVFSAY